MARQVRWLTALAMLLCLPPVLGAQQETSPAARKLVDALAQLKQDPSSPAIQQQYVASFPQDYAQFEELFEPGQALYDEYYDDINALMSLADENTEAVGSLLLRLSKDAHYEADALSYLQNATTHFAATHTADFVRQMELLRPGEQAHVVTFLADVENFDGYEDYQAAINRLKGLNKVTLAKQFEAARAKRRARHDH